MTVVPKSASYSSSFSASIALLVHFGEMFGFNNLEDTCKHQLFFTTNNESTLVKCLKC